jgi:hypothetical protein
MRKERVYTTRGKTDEKRGQQRIRQSDKRTEVTERNRRNSVVEFIFGRSFEGGEESNLCTKFIQR